MNAAIRPLVVAIAALVTAVGGVLAVAIPASAHDYLVESDPAAGSIIATLPEAFSITANERLPDLAGEGNGFGLLVQDEAGRYYGEGCVVVSEATLSTDAAIGDPGTYTVTWQIVSADGHPVSDTFTFEWTGAATAEGSTTRPECEGRNTAATPPEEADAFDATPLWIGGAVLLVVVAVAVTLALLRRPRVE